MKGFYDVRLRIIFGISLYAAFLLLFIWLGKESVLRRLVRKTRSSLDAAARQRARESRRLLLMQQERRGIVYRIEQRLVYSGLTVRFRWLTPELWIVGNLAVCGIAYFGILFISGSWQGALTVGILLQLVRYFAESMLMGRNYRSVNDNLVKFLDFLGNYSITAGEVTGILNQISRYLDEPLRTVLDECYYEAQTSGDAGLALLAMAEKIEHPRFKELVRNLEISVRYDADFTTLVKNSRRDVREHMRTRQERKALVSEAMVNMLLLAGMSVVVLAAVEKLIGTSMWLILRDTWPGRICLAVVLIIFSLLYRQIRRIDQ